MRRQRVDSSVIATIAHDARTNTLEIVFHNGRTYYYLDVPLSVYQDLATAESVGKYFNEEVRPRYRALRVRDE